MQYKHLHVWQQKVWDIPRSLSRVHEQRRLREMDTLSVKATLSNLFLFLEAIFFRLD